MDFDGIKEGVGKEYEKGKDKLKEGVRKAGDGIEHMAD